MRERGGGLAADDGGGLLDEIVVRERLHHKEGEVHAASQIAFEDGVAHVAAPDRQALAVAFFEIAAGSEETADITFFVEIGSVGQDFRFATAIQEYLCDADTVGSSVMPVMVINSVP